MNNEVSWVHGADFWWRMSASIPEPEPDMNTASRMGSSTEPVRIQMPPKFGQRMDAEEGWLEAKNENNVIWWLCAKVKTREYSKVVDEG